MSKSAFIPFIIVIGIMAGLPDLAYTEPTNTVHIGTNQPGLHEQFKTMTPEQQRAKIQELRRAHGVSTNVPESLTAEQRRARIQIRLEELRHKQAAGTLTPIESKQLSLLESRTNKPASTKMVGPVKAPRPAPASTNFQFLSK